MIKKVDHIGIAASSLDEIKNVYGKILSDIQGHEYEVESQKSKILSFDLGGVHLEFLEPSSPDSPIAKFIDKKGPGLHHVALETDDITSELEKLKKDGLKLIDNEPRIGMNGAKIAFVHPKSSGGVLLEVVEK